MSNLDLSRSAKALLDAAKSDGPSAAARAKIWGGVASGAGAVGVGVGASAIAAGTASAAPPALAGAGLAAGAGGLHGATAAATGGKLLAMGALFGSALTVGIAATLLGIGRTPSLLPDPQYAESAPMVQPAYTNGGGVHPSGAAANARANAASGSMIANPANDGLPNSANAMNAFGANANADSRNANSVDSAGTRGDRNNGIAAANGTINAGAALSTASGASDVSGGRANGSAGAPAGAVAPHHGDPTVRAVREDTLMRESALVGEARGALMRGDSKAALAALKATKTLKHRELEPEELSLEAKALRAMGRDGDAASLEIVLKSRYPDHALAR